MRNLFRDSHSQQLRDPAATDERLGQAARELAVPEVNQRAIELAATAAVTRALDEYANSDRPNILVVNVNIQIASGEGASNQIGTQNRANDHTRYGDRERY